MRTIPKKAALILCTMAFSIVLPAHFNIPAAIAESSYTISKTSSGLIASDALTETKTREQLQADQSYWRYGGSAVGLNAPYDFFQDPEGLHIGVQAPKAGTWAGYYAVSQPSSAILFHAVLTTKFRTIPANYFNNGLYVQTTIAKINYVTCVSNINAEGTTWSVVSATGNADRATKFKILWSDTSPNQPLTRDCTIITNGKNYLKVYLDSVKVYESHSLTLQMPPPFEAYLEPQNSYAEQMLYGIYRDFYVALDEMIKVSNIPSAGVSAKVIDASGNVLSTAPISSGQALLNVGQYHFPLAAYIKVYNSNNVEIASTSSPESIIGGDIYSVNGQPPGGGQPPGSPITLTIQSVSLSGTIIEGLWTEIYDANFKLITAGYTTYSYAGTSGTQYTVCMADYKNYLFDHWDDGSTNRCRTIIPTQNTTLTAYYQT